MKKGNKLRYSSIFRIIFVCFMLYLLKDAFFRWDGFRFYATITDFLPNLSLVTLIWAITALAGSLAVWLPLRIMQVISRKIDSPLSPEQLIMFAINFVIIGYGVWMLKRLVGVDIQTTLALKIGVFTGVAVLCALIVKKFPLMAASTVKFIQDRLTPLVWIAGIWLVVSIVFTGYNLTISNEHRVDHNGDVSRVSSTGTRPNIILILFDTLTARDMSLYGYERDTTPFLKEWGRQATVFSRHEAESNLTTPAVASLMTGKRLWTHQTYHIRGAIPKDSEDRNLPRLLRENGYSTRAYIANDAASIKILGLGDEFDIIPNPMEFGRSQSIRDSIRFALYSMFGENLRMYNWIFKGDTFFTQIMGKISQDFKNTRFPAESVFEVFFSDLKKKSDAPYFAYVHLFPPHAYYLSPEPYMGMFDPSDEMRTFNEQKIGLSMIAEFLNRDKEKHVAQKIDLLRARYDEFIRYCDDQFKNFINELDQRGELDNTIIIFTSDHGESFEHNYITHAGKHMYEQVTHVPLIIKEPGQVDGKIVNDIVEQMDIPATILEFAGITVPTWMEARSVVPLIRGESLPSRPAFAMNLEKNMSRDHKVENGTIAVWDGDYKLIHFLEEDKSMLFNLAEDPGEVVELSEKEPEVRQKLYSLIMQALNEVNENRLSAK
ncbi:MAG: sulfatase-like hydrolase/transferase [Nitrospira sp.]|nr:sulfatase-like hydrolase/transferase [Nitrospira sp.]